MYNKELTFNLFPKDAYSDLDLEAPLSQIGRSIQKNRVAKNMTQEALAERSGVSLKTVRRLEKGDNVSLKILCDVLSALGEMKYLLLSLDAPHFGDVKQTVKLSKNKTQLRRHRKSSKFQTGKIEVNHHV